MDEASEGCFAGIHKEALQWPLLMELCWLLPAIHLHIVMVSPSLPAGLPRHGQWVSCSAQTSVRGKRTSMPVACTHSCKHGSWDSGLPSCHDMGYWHGLVCVSGQA